MNKGMHNRWTLTGAVCIIIAFLLFLWLDMPTFFTRTISFSSEYKGEAVNLEASLWEVEGAEYGVLICPGYSCDRQKWRPFSNLFVKEGFTTMTFDYAGQGASGGSIGFDNAKTDEIPLEISHAIETMKQETGLDEEHIILVGHSMGGRSILRLLQDYNNAEAETKVNKQSIRNVILVSPEVNYKENTQANLFAGTTDAVEEPWSSFCPDYIAGTNVYLFGSTADDIVKSEDIYGLRAHLLGEAAGETPKGSYSYQDENPLGSRITVEVIGGVLHSYQMYSPRFATLVSQALQTIWPGALEYGSYHFLFVYIGWAFSLAGIFLFMKGLVGKYSRTITSRYRLVNGRQFLLRKLVLWIPGIVLAFVICCLCMVIPFGSPIMNIPYMCFIAGYGILMLFLYRKGYVAGVEVLKKQEEKRQVERKTILDTAFVVAGISFFAWFVLRATMYRLYPFNNRLYWLIIATIFMAVGYYVSGEESDMLEMAHATRKEKLLYSLIQYVPLFLFVTFYLVIGSYSGLIGQILNVVLMYILCIPIGDYVRRKLGSRLVSAILTAFLFQSLMITSAALISFF